MVPRRSRLRRYERELDDWFAELGEDSSDVAAGQKRATGEVRLPTMRSNWLHVVTEGPRMNLLSFFCVCGGGGGGGGGGYVGMVV